jgi:hypothetical protein
MVGCDCGRKRTKRTKIREKAKPRTNKNIVKKI